jgi:hypothetical protein
MEPFLYYKLESVIQVNIPVPMQASIQEEKGIEI